MFILRFSSRAVKAVLMRFVGTLLFQKVKVEQQARGGAHLALELEQLWIGVPGSYRPQHRFKGVETLWVEWSLCVLADTPPCHGFTVSGSGSLLKDAELAVRGRLYCLLDSNVA